jgi:hypothetical protein
VSIRTVTSNSLSSALTVSVRDRLGVGDAGDRELLLAGEAQRPHGLPVRELQWQDPHANEVGAVDALKALGDDRAHAQQARPLGRPVAGGAGSVLLARQDDEGRVLLHVAHGGVVDRHLLLVAATQIHRHAALSARSELVAQADVGEGAAHHHLVVAAA